MRAPVSAAAAPWPAPSVSIRVTSIPWDRLAGGNRGAPGRIASTEAEKPQQYEKTPSAPKRLILLCRAPEPACSLRPYRSRDRACAGSIQDTPMVPVSGIRASSADLAVGGSRRETAAPSAPASRALIPLQPLARSDLAARDRPQASFLAHLIATDRQLPQTRERRRGEPGDAIAAYAAVDAGTPARAGGTLSRTT